MPQRKRFCNLPRCQIGRCEGAAERAWQPFGPADRLDSFSILGCHYRGFPVIKVCDTHKAQLESGADLGFTYRGQPYLAVHALNRCVASPF